MALEPRITFRSIKPSSTIEELVREKTAKLEKFHDKISTCEVVIEEPHRRHKKGDLFHVRIHMVVPGGEIVVVRDPTEATEHEDLRLAIRDAFEAARKQLQSHVRRRREEPRRDAAE